MTKPSIDLSIILPSYMEAKNIAGTLDSVAKYLATRSFGEVEVVVVTANSPDGTAAIARSKAHLFNHFHLVEPGPRVGKGRDVRLGIFESSGRYKVFMDADLATPLVHIDSAYQALQGGVPVVIAVRDLWSIHKGLLRKLMSKGGNLFIQLLILPGIKDTQCGFKAFRSDVAEEIFSRQTMLGWSFDAEILKIARLRHYKIAQIDAPDWRDPKQDGHGLVGDSAFSAAVKTLLDTVTIRLNAWSGKYNHVSYTHKSMY
jgi:dolichyl-phosphate beta-glucosyltransferase